MNAIWNAARFKSAKHYREKQNSKIQSSPCNLKHIGCDGEVTQIHIFPTVGQIILKKSILFRSFSMTHDCINALSLCRQWTYGMLRKILSKITYLIRRKQDCCTFLFAFHKNRKGKSTLHVPFVTNGYVAWFFLWACAFLKKTELKK